MTNDSVRSYIVIKGYIVIVLKNLGYKTEKIEKVLDELHYVFNVISEIDAEQYFYSRKWQENK